MSVVDRLTRCGRDLRLLPVFRKAPSLPVHLFYNYLFYCFSLADEIGKRSVLCYLLVTPVHLASNVLMQREGLVICFHSMLCLQCLLFSVMC